MYSKLMAFLLSNNILYKHQYDFSMSNLIIINQQLSQSNVVFLRGYILGTLLYLIYVNDM